MYVGAVTVSLPHSSQGLGGQGASTDEELQDNLANKQHHAVRIVVSCIWAGAGVAVEHSGKQIGAGGQVLLVVIQDAEDMRAGIRGVSTQWGYKVGAGKAGS